MIGQSPLCRLGTAHPQAVDAVFRKILRQPHFIWAKRGWARCENRKLWYQEHEAHPHIAVIGARLSELIGR
jgi:hypothetical protein